MCRLGLGEECENQQQADAKRDAHIRNVEGRKEREIDEVDNPAVEEPVSACDAIDEIADRTTENHPECNGLAPTGCVRQDEHDHTDDDDRNNCENRAALGEHRERSTRVVGQPELEEVGDDDNRPGRQNCLCPPFRQLIQDNDASRDGQRQLNVGQMRFAASTVVVAYGSASSRATGIGSPVTSHMP